VCARLLKVFKLYEMKFTSVAFVISFAALGYRYYNNGAKEVGVVVDKEMPRLEKRNMAVTSSFQIKSRRNTGLPGPRPSVEDSLRISENGCSVASPCSKCTGSCLLGTECASDLQCFNRSGSEPIPNCVTGGIGDISGTHYCYEKPPNGTVTYIPGDITKVEAGLSLSTGLTARIIATSGKTMPGSSNLAFHYEPDAGAVFPLTDGG